MRLVGALVVVALALASVPAEARAQAADDLLARHAELDRELGRPESPRRERRLVQLLDRAIDYPMIVRRVLVLHWDELTEAQRTEVSDLLTRAIRHRYRASVEALRGWDVRVTSEARRGIGRRVETEARRDEERRSIGYDLYQREDAWRVVDLIVDGDSLVHQYRTQFDGVIRREGWGGFLTRLRDRVSQDGA